jgi:glycosyltransferase involved in cell wall biosynthesis
MLYQMADGFTERFVDYFLVVSAVLEQAMIKGHGIPPGRVIKLYNGIETDHYRPENLEGPRRRIREEFALGNGDLLIGAVGRFVWQKGFIYFLQALPALIEDIPQARFVLVGDGPLRQELEGQAKSLGIQDRLLLTGHRRDIRDIMAALDIMVIPSLLEGFPMVTLEAMAMQRPIVATAIDGITEQISDDIEGLLVPPRAPEALVQAIRRLATDPSYARSLGSRARKRVVADFSVQKMITETMKVYERLC